MERAWDDDDLPDYGPVTQGEHRKAEVAKFKNTKKSKQLVKQNRHRWQSFNERLDGVQVDVLRRTGRDSQRGNKSLLDEGFDEDFGSHFEAQVAKWAELNLTADFTEFLHVVQQYVGSLALVLHNKDAILEALLARLAQPKCLAIKPLCGCLAALARDLRQEFYPFLQPRVLPVLLGLLDTQDADLLEDVFSCIAFLFKFLLRFVVDDFAATFTLLFPALRHKQWYIRKFSAEVLSFLVRKLPAEALSPALAHVLDTAAAAMVPCADAPLGTYAMAHKRQQVEEGVSQLLFEAVKGVQHGFHSRFALTSRVLVALVPARLAGARERRAVVASFFARVCDHCRAEEADGLWDTLSSILDVQLAAPTGVGGKRKLDAEGGDGQGGRVEGGAEEGVRYLASAVAHRDGSRLGAQHVRPLMQRLRAAFECREVLEWKAREEEGGRRGKSRGARHAGEGLLECAMALGVALLMHGEREEVEACEQDWRWLFAVPAAAESAGKGSRWTELSLDAALQLCDAGRCQGSVRSAVWALCARLAAGAYVKKLRPARTQSIH